MHTMKSRLFLFLVLGMGLFSACKKDDVSAPETPKVDSELIKDSVLAYSKDIYLWYEQIPSTFNPRTYEDPDKIMTALRQYSIEPGFSGPVDRWSFAFTQAEWDDVSSGISGDFGLGVFFRTEGDLRVKMVEK